MNDLIQKANELLTKRYKRPIHTVAAVLEMTDGRLYEGLNIDHFSGYVCAETSALAQALNDKNTRFKRIVAVRREPDGTQSVANMCGKCRQIFFDYAPGISVITLAENNPKECRIEELLPYAFTRQQQKIQEALADENAPEVVG